MKRVFLLAGEASGDKLGGALMDGPRAALLPASPSMASAGR